MTSPVGRFGALFALLFAVHASPLLGDVIYTNQATFLSNVQPGSYLETFDGLPVSTVIPSPLSFSGNGFGYTASCPGGFYNSQFLPNPYLTADGSGTSIVFTMTSNNITAIGGYFFAILTVTGEPGSGTTTVTLDDGSSFSVVHAPSNSFIGFTTSLPIHSITVSNTTHTDWVAVNDFIVGTAVPEPSSGLLMVGGAISLVGLGYRHRVRCLCGRNTTNSPRSS